MLGSSDAAGNVTGSSLSTRPEASTWSGEGGSGGRAGRGEWAGGRWGGGGEGPGGRGGAAQERTARRPLGWTGKWAGCSSRWSPLTDDRLACRAGMPQHWGLAGLHVPKFGRKHWPVAVSIWHVTSRHMTTRSVVPEAGKICGAGQPTTSLAARCSRHTNSPTVKIASTTMKTHGDTGLMSASVTSPRLPSGTSMRWMLGKASA
jgi:hypothetical protein